MCIDDYLIQLKIYQDDDDKKLEKQIYTENIIALLADHFFPQKMVHFLRIEYGGDQKVPS